MRIRSIKPEFFRAKDTGLLSHSQRLLLIGLWCYADREGVFEPDFREIKNEIFTRDKVSEAKIESWLKTLVTHGFIVRMECDYTTYLSKNVIKSGVLYRVNGFDASYNIGKNERVRFNIKQQNQQNQTLYAVHGPQDIGDRIKDLGPTDVGPKDLGNRIEEQNRKQGAGPESGPPRGGPIRPAGEGEKTGPPSGATPPVAPTPPTQEQIDAFMAKLREDLRK